VDEGLLDLDAPVVDFLPELRLPDERLMKDLTLRHLLTHTSGIDGDIFVDTGRGDDCLREYVRLLEHAAVNHPLGATFSYCNSGYSLIGRIIEVVTGMTWDAALRERLIKPLGLAHTTTLPEEVMLERFAVGHDGHGAEQKVVPAWGLPRSAGPAGLISSIPREVLEFAALHLRGGLAADGSRVLSEQAVGEMSRHQADLPDKISMGDSWGLGWIRFDAHGDRLIGHDGNTIGQSAFLRMLPEQGLAVTLLTNGGQPRELCNALFGEIFAELAGVDLPDPIKPVDEDPASTIESSADGVRFVGTYDRTGLRTEVFLEDGALMLRSTVSGLEAEYTDEPVTTDRLHPVSEGVYAVRAEESGRWLAVTFYQLADGSEYVHYGIRANPKVVS
jgi:CubicO group peptidase (beta-lactamase class C family)